MISMIRTTKGLNIPLTSIAYIEHTDTTLKVTFTSGESRVIYKEQIIEDSPEQILEAFNAVHKAKSKQLLFG